MNVEFPVDEKSLRYIESLEGDPDISAILQILLDKKNADFHNYASIICFCYKEEDLANLMDVKHLPRKVKAWIKRKSFDNDPTYLKFFRHLYALYSSFQQTYEGWDKLGKYRSLFPESYVYHKLLDKYSDIKDAVVSRECYIVIDGWDSRVDRSRKEGQKMDAAAWDRGAQSGEVYEAKVKVYIKDKEHQLEFLEKIHEVSEGRICAVLASFAPKRVVLNHLRSFFPGRDLSRICIYGIDELQKM
ncbi:MAG TPA: hypothetical protein ENJ37_01315 [Deltaproteobacteria bacterium]|nr:hypothetical protein [Deltaproteobacteria bacterium]